jgi:tellurite resistance-related uncharacterized protein
VLRPITAFIQDDAGDWVAELACGHRQHARHKPPFWSAPWVLDATARAAKIGSPLPCVLCDRFEMPAGYVAYKRTPEFDTESVPDGLKRHHSTKHGVWARIRVIAGRLRYVVEEPLATERILEPGSDGIVVAEVRHHVEPLGDVRFYVEFYRRAS